jgi:hypothetical protein
MLRVINNITLGDAIMDMSFKGVDKDIAAYIHSYRVRKELKTLTEALEGIVKDLETHENAQRPNKPADQDQEEEPK